MGGSAWTNQVVSLLVVQSGGNFQGIFVYSPTPGAGNLVGSWAAAAGTDPYGNAYDAGAVSYGSAGISALNAGQVLVGVAAQFAGTFNPGRLTNSALTTGETALFSGQTGAGDTESFIELFSQTRVGVTTGRMLLAAGQVELGATGNALWDDNAQQFNLPVAGGPFISGESFHTVSNGTNFTGTMRVKKLPWNAVWLDVQINYTATAAVTANFGSLPDATYYPTVARQFALSCTQAQTAVGSSNRVFVPLSGAVQVVIPQALAAASGLSLSVMYPTN